MQEAEARSDQHIDVKLSNVVRLFEPLAHRRRLKDLYCLIEEDG